MIRLSFEFNQNKLKYRKILTFLVRNLHNLNFNVQKKVHFETFENFFNFNITILDLIKNNGFSKNFKKIISLEILKFLKKREKNVFGKIYGNDLLYKINFSKINFFLLIIFIFTFFIKYYSHFSFKTLKKKQNYKLEKYLN